MEAFQRKCEADREQFATLVAASNSASQAGALRLKEEDDRLRYMRGEIAREKSLLEERRIEVEFRLL